MIVAQATLLDLAEITSRANRARQSTVSADEYRQILCQLGGGPAWSVRSPDGDLLMLGGLYLRGAEPAVAWFVSGPRCGRHLRRIVALIRRRLAELAPHVPGILCSTSAANGVGQRLARLLGFELEQDVVLRIGAFRIWRRADGQSS